MEAMDATMLPQTTGVTAQSPAATAAAALQSNSLGVGFSGSGFLIMYFVGVTSILRSLGILTPTTSVSGSSGGSVAAAMSCANVPTPQFLAAVRALANTCALTANCRGTLDAAVSSGLFFTLPLDAHTRCQSRLWVSVTRAQINPGADVERKVTVFANRATLLQALSASSYIPRFSGVGLVKTTSLFNGSATDIGAMYAYDGVATNPLPVPPTSSGVTYTIRVSAIANGTNPPTFSSLAADVNSDPSSALLSPVALFPKTLFPLNPTLAADQTTILDIYPGLSGALPMTNDEWNRFTQIAPTNAMLQIIYDTGRQDAAAWVNTNIPSLAAGVPQALTATAFTV